MNGCCNFIHRFTMKNWICRVLQLCVLCGVHSSTNGYHHVIYIDPDNGVNNCTCLINPGSDVPCKGINYALESGRINNSTKFVLKENTTHILEHSAPVFSITQDIAIVSRKNDSNAVIECGNNAGLAFEKSHNICLSNIQFRYCGHLRNSTTTKHKNFLKFYVALYFYECANVTLTRVVVENSSNATGVVMYDTAGTNYILDSSFSGNPPESQAPHGGGGGGFAVEFTYCQVGQETCSNQTQMISNASYLFQNCNFSHNHAYEEDSRSLHIIIPSGKNHRSFGRGGGLSLYFKGKATANTATLENCRFNGNKAIWGGGMIIQFDDRALQNTVNVSSSYFLQNYAKSKNDSYETGGGAIRIASYVYKTDNASTRFKRNTVNIEDSIFERNSGTIGGAISLSMGLQQTKSTQLTTIAIKHCVFNKSMAKIGSAIEI